MKNVFFQTADARVYARLLGLTSKTVLTYCEANGHHYQAFLGVKRGYWPWHASYNRIYIFEELLARGDYDWAVFLDADAFVSDLTFDLDAYLSDKAGFAAIMTHSDATPDWWDVNDGVMLLNLRHPEAHTLVQGWKQGFETAFTDTKLRAQVHWANPNDQDLVQRVLIANPHLKPLVMMESRKLMNSMEARFIKQFVRESCPDLNTRTAEIEKRVNEIMADRDAATEAATRLAACERREDLVNGAYTELLGRLADETGLLHFTTLLEREGEAAGLARLYADIKNSQEHRARVGA